MRKFLIFWVLLGAAYGQFAPSTPLLVIPTSSATATVVGSPFKLPTYSSPGILQVVMTGITGSPSGCSLAVSGQPFYSATASLLSTLTFTPATGIQFLQFNPSVQALDQLVATFACSVYPTAGALTVTFAPLTTEAIANTDPCQSPSVAKSSVVVNVTSATTTQLVAAVAGKSVYVCGFMVNILGLVTTAGTIQFEYSTVASCASSTTVLTGAIPGSTTAGASDPVVMPTGATSLTAPASNALCLVTTGTTPGFQGFVSYVQQ